VRVLLADPPATRTGEEAHAGARLLSLAQAAGTNVVIRRSDQFIRRYGAREIGNAEFPKLLKALLPAFRETAKALAAQRLGLDQAPAREIADGSGPRASPSRRSFPSRLES
jgi:hypothetical protein